MALLADITVFRPDPTVPIVAATREHVVALVESINQPQISIPTKPPQAVQGHLVGVRNASGSFSVHVVLFLTQSGENVVYVHEPRELSFDDYREAEAEGLGFLESMGFMLDDLNFRSLTREQQEATLRRLPIFSRPAPPRAPAPAAPDAAAALARLLASF